MTADVIARQLGGRKSGSGWMACCVAHDENNPSLSIGERDGKVLLKCFAGCEQRAIIDALRARGLWNNDTRREHPEAWGRIVATYDYQDERGQLVYQVCRLEPKSFRPRRQDGNGGWTWGYGNVTRLLYRLPELLEAPIVFVPEGERDCDTLRAYGFTATTNAGGAKAWREEFNSFFQGREVIILPDNDAPGWTRAVQIARGVLPFAASVRVVELTDSKDVTEWFQRGHSEVELIAEVEECHAF